MAMSYGYYWDKGGLRYDVDMSMLVHMRDMGMSNKQIADKLGVSYSTILKYLGKQPKVTK